MRALGCGPNPGVVGPDVGNGARGAHGAVRLHRPEVRRRERPRPDRGLDQPGFRALLELGRSGRANVKLSGVNKFSGDCYPYSDVHPFVDALIAAFTLDACMWGSDWPFLRAAERIDYGPLLLWIEALIQAETDRRQLLWDTP